MAFERPTLSELVDRIQQDFVSRLELGGAVLRRSMVQVLARVVAGAAHMLHGHLEYQARQIFPDTADEVNVLRWGALFGIERNAPEFATGSVEFTGTNTTVIPIGTVLIRADGVEYTTDAEVTITLGVAEADVTASEAGEDGNADVDTALSLESPITGVDADPSVSVELAGGTDEEELEDYRTRILERMRAAPHGGSEADYIAWAKAVPGVTRVWVTPDGMGAGTVLVRFMRDDDVSPIPSGGEVTTVQDYLDSVRPVTAAVTVAAPTAAALAFNLSIEPDTSAVRDAVEAELADLLRNETAPGETLLLSKIRTAIGIATGLEDYTLTSPAADVTHTSGQIATLGTVTFT